MTIFSDGTSKFIGEEHTNTIGAAVYNFSKESVVKLFEDLKNLDFDGFKEKPSYIADVPETKIVYHDKTIIIKDVRSLSNDFKEVVETLKRLSRSTGFVN